MIQLNPHFFLPFRPYICRLQLHKNCVHVSVNYGNYIKHLIKIHQMEVVKGNSVSIVQATDIETASLQNGTYPRVVYKYKVFILYICATASLHSLDLQR